MICLRDRYAVFATQRGDTATRPAVPPAGSQSVAIQDTGDGGVVTDASQAAHRGYDVLRCRCAACPATAARQAQFGMYSSLPVNHQDYFASRRVDVRDHLV